MKLIQLILGSGVIVSLLVYFRYLRSSMRDRLLAALLALVAFSAVMFPQLTTDIASIIGVGRGTDLTFYLFAIASSFVIILLYSRLQRLERLHTETVRALAISQAKQAK